MAVVAEIVSGLQERILALEQQLAQARESEERAHENNSASIPIAGQMARKQAFLDAAKLADKYAIDYWKDGARNIAEALRLEAEKQ